MYSSVNAQTFQKMLGGNQPDNGMAVTPSADGGYVACGSTSSFGNNNSQIYLVKYNNEGDTLWTRTYDFGNLDYGNAIQLTSDGGFIVAGRTFTGTVNYDDLLLLKVSADGTTEWAKAYGGGETDQASSVRQTADGGYIAAGYSVSFGAGLEDIYLVKTSANGDIEWTKTYGGNVTDQAYAVWQNDDGGYTVAGSIRSFLPNNDGVIMRTDADGDIIWSKAIGGNESDVLYSMEQTEDGGFIAAGTRDVALNFDFLLTKVDADGNESWTKQIGGGGDNYCFQVKQTDDGGYALAGFYVVPFFGADGYLVRTNAAGDTLWTRTYGGSGDDQMKALTWTNDGGYLLCGHTTSFGSGNGDFYIVKTDADGMSNCNESNPNVEIVAPTIDYEDWTPEVGTGGTVTELVPFVGAGGLIHTNCTSVEIDDALNDNEGLSIYPNPVQNILQLKSMHPSSDQHWYVLNLYGQLIDQGKIVSGYATIDVSNYSVGLYQIKYQGNNLKFEVIR